MQTLDLIIIFGYLIGITVFGILFSGKQETTTDYFVGGRNVPWWAIAMSIVATETSTITFISVPGIAFARNGNFQFLQLVFGYMLGRVVISLIFIPLYFKGDLQTVYQLLGERFGNKVKMLASGLFVVMRNIADGIRLLLTAIVLAAVYTAFVPEADQTTVIVGSVILLGLVMIVFTYFGGMEAIIWIEVVQLGIYIGGAIAAAVVLANSIEGGFAGAIEIGRQFDKFDVFDFTWDFTKTYTFWAGLIGGCFLTMSTHGTDQYLVQRYLCTDKASRASLALLSSGAVVLGQFIGFLFIGVLLFAFYAPYNLAEYAQAGVAGSGIPAQFPFTGGDKVFPDFITKSMPSGLSGLVVAAIFAAALSSSLNSIAATFVNDLYKPFKKNPTDKHLFKVSHILTLVFGIVQIAVALLVMRQERSALDQALSVASLFNGPVLGVFLIGTFLKRVTEMPALIGMIASIALMFYIRFYTPIAFPWYVLIGSVTTFTVAYLASLLSRVIKMKFLLSLLLICAITGTSPLLAFQVKSRSDVPFWPSKKSIEFAAKQVKKMSVEEKVGQLVHVGINARFANQQSPFFKDLQRHVVENKVGGIIFFGAPLYETTILANRMQQNAKLPLLLSLDAETGIGMRFEDATNFPWAMAVAATGNPEFARRMGVITGREARAIGIRHVYAPVLDVNNNAANPVINVRSFGESPDDVARFGIAFAEGIQSQQVIATAKHFPGHGDTNVDSHRGLPIIDLPRSRFDAIELAPFKKAVDAGIGSIMIAHIALPQIDGEEIKPLKQFIQGDAEAGAEIVKQQATIPATLSEKVQTGILRNEMGFKGLIVSDAMSMSGLTIYFSQEEAGVRAFLAGTDILEKPADVEGMIRGLTAAVKTGRIPMSKLDDSVTRQIAWKHELGLFKNRTTAVEQIDRLVAGPETLALTDEVATKAITLVRQDNSLPLSRSAKTAVLGLSNGFDGPPTMSSFVNGLRTGGLTFSLAYLQENSTTDQIKAAKKAVDEADTVVVGLYGRVRSGAKNSVGIPDNGVEILKNLLKSKKKIIGVSFGNPYVLGSFPELKTYLVAYGDMASLQRASARALLGTQDITGTLPITLPGLHTRGTGIQIEGRNAVTPAR